MAEAFDKLKKTGKINNKLMVKTVVFRDIFLIIYPIYGSLEAYSRLGIHLRKFNIE